MRYFYCLASLLLLQIVTGLDFRKAISSGKHDVSSSPTNCEISGDPERWKRSSQAHNHRGQRQVGYFETAGENNLENDFPYQDLRNSGLRDDEKLESADAGLGQNRFEKSDQDASAAGSMNGDTLENSKFQLFNPNENFPDSDQSMFRRERQTKRYEPKEKSELSKNFISLLKWNKNKELNNDFFPAGVQKNEAYPVNDDVADFAVYMNRSNRRRGKSKGNGSSNTNINQDGRYEAQVRRGYLPIEYSDRSENFTNSERQGQQYTSNLSDDTLLESVKIKKDTSNIVDDLIFSEAGAKVFDNTNYANSQRTLYDPYPSLTNLIKTASADEGDSDQQEMNENRQGNTGLVGDVIREKTIILPEPLVFNSSHVVSSFVYTMIPFRSPLLNLLENDKHSKYIMIKIDPVLQPSKRISLSEQQPARGGNTEYELEQNVMRVIDKLIGSDLQWDLNSVEGLPRSKQKSRVVGARHHRKTDEQANQNIRSVKSDETNRLNNGVVS